MIEPKNNAEPKPIVRCSECDNEVDNYVTFVNPTNEMVNVCWECQNRKDKDFFWKRDWGREARQGYIPR